MSSSWQVGSQYWFHPQFFCTDAPITQAALHAFQPSFHPQISCVQEKNPGFTWQTPALFRWSPSPGLNAATLLAALAPIRLGLAERPGDAGTWSELLQTAQLEVQGELLSLIEMEQVEERGMGKFLGRIGDECWRVFLYLYLY